MAVTCRAILILPKFKNVFTLLAGEKGLENPIRWTHFLESETEVEFLQGNELVFTTGIAFQNNAGQLVSLIKKLHDHHAAGLIINVGKYFENISDEILSCAENLGFPLISVPWQNKLVNITRIIGRMVVEDSFRAKAVSQLLESILFAVDGSFTEYAATMEYYNFDVAVPMRIAIYNFPNLKNYLLNQDIAITKEEFQFIIFGIVNNAMQRSQKKYLYLWRNYNLIMTIPVSQTGEAALIETLFEEIKGEICHRMPKLITHIGLGGDYDSLEKLRISYREANFALRICDKNLHSAYVLYRTTGVYKLFNKIHDFQVLKEFYNEMLDPLFQYDTKNNSEFAKTLETYFTEGKNVIAASEILYIHRNTLKYRLHRIEEILGYSLCDPEEEINLQIAFKIKKYISLLGKA